MLPVILIAVGAYLIGDSVLDGKKYAKGGEMAKGGKVKMPEWAVTVTSEDGDSHDWDGFAKDEDDALTKAEKEAGFDSVESSVMMITDENGEKIEYKKGGEMAKGGKLVGKQKNLDVNKNGKLDAQDFKMLRGKKMADGGLVVKSDEDLREIAKYMATMIKKKRWDFKDLVYYFEKENNYDYNYRVKIWDEMNVYEMKKTEENVYKVLKAIVEANEAKK